MTWTAPETLRARQARLQNASELMRQGRRGEAVEILRTLVAEAPDIAQAQRLLGVGLHESGDLAEAETVFRRALALQPDLTTAATSLSEVLRALGRPLEAAALLEPRVTAATTNLSLLCYFGLALQSAGRLDEATSTFERAIAAHPGSGVAEHNIAGALIEARDFAGGVAAIERAFAKGLDAPETWLQYARALTALSRPRDAESAYHQVLRRRPGDVDAVVELAELAWRRTGDDHAARTALAAASAGSAPSAALLLRKSRLLDYMGDLPGAYEAIAQTIALKEDAMAHVLAVGIAVRFDADLATAHAARARSLSPDDPNVIAGVCQLHLALGRADEAAVAAGDLCQKLPNDQYAVALLATAWRLLGDPRYSDLHDYEHFVDGAFLDVPPGWNSLDTYLEDLRAALEPLHAYPGHPIGQSLRRGSQSHEELTRSDAPAIRALFPAIDGPIRRHIARLGPGADRHRSRATGGYRLTGMWSARLPAAGYHADHIHPKGWLSSALHISVPRTVQAPPDGWLKFGEPGTPTLPRLEADHFVRPEPGRLVLFPSYMWHGTAPFSGDEARLTVAFDVVPT